MPQPSRLAREAVPGADKRSWDAGGGVDVCWKQDPCRLIWKPGLELALSRVLSFMLPRSTHSMNTPPATRPAAVVTPTLQQLPRLDGFLVCKEAQAPPAMPAIIDWSTAREAPRATPSMDVPRHGTDARRRKYARRRSSDATPSSVMHVIARGSSDQWKTFASSPLMAAAMLIDGEIYDE